MTLAKVYDELSLTYDEKYVHGGLDNPYMVDENYAREHWKEAKLKGSIVSLGVGTGQDIEILCHPHPDLFVGYDISPGMLALAEQKFPGYNLKKHDCNQMINRKADVLVAIFGAANYLGADKLKEHYENMECKNAFFIFYDEKYVDGVADVYHTYDKNELEVIFSEFNPTVTNLFEGSNYYVVWWNNED